MKTWQGGCFFQKFVFNGLLLKLRPLSEVDYLNTIRKFTLFLCLPYIKACVLYIASNQEKSNKLLFKYDIDAIFDYIKVFLTFIKTYPVQEG